MGSFTINADIEDAIIKKFGDVFSDASVLKNENRVVIPTTPQADIMLSGGIPEGTFTVISGPPGLGKSAFALHVAAQAQKHDSKFGPRKIYYFDIEARIKERDLFHNKCLDTSPERFQLIKSTEKKLVIGEEFLMIGEQLIRNKPGCVFIFDSFSAMCTKSREDTDLDEGFRDNSAALLSAFIKRVNQVVPVNRSVVIGITHRMANQGMGMKKWVEASGEKIQYRADVKLKGTHSSAWKIGEDQIGQDVFWECEKSALGAPNKKATCKLRYYYGYDEVAELVDVCVNLALIKKNGTWLKYVDVAGEEKKLQGSEKMTAFLKDNPTEFSNLRSQVSEYCGNKQE